MSDGPTSEVDPAVTTRVIWGTTVNIQDAMSTFKQFLLRFERRYVLESTGHRINEADCEPFYPHLLQQMHDTESVNLNLDCANLAAYSPAEKLYHQLLKYPQEIIPMMDYVLCEVYAQQFPNAGNIPLKVNKHDQLVTVKGLLIRSSAVIPDLKLAFFRCSYCENTIAVGIERGRIAEPTQCPRKDCRNFGTMQLIHNRCEYADKQISRLQETPDEIPDGQTPHTVSLCMYDDMVDVAKPGDRLEVTGIYRGLPVRVNPRQRTVKTLFRTYLDIVHVKKVDKKRVQPDKTLINDHEFVPDYDESDELQELDANETDQVVGLSRRVDIYDLLARSLAPSIYEHDDVKKGILLQLFGGTQKTFQKSGAPKTRGDINILLVGDPSTSKSQLLQYAHKIAPRGVFTSGKGSSAVGLTAYVTRDPDTKQLVLESGALVLSDGGLCCIDEFDKMSDATRSILHEVMEQQTVSVAKAGIITTLNARSSILACANPIDSRWNEKLPVAHNIDLPPPLLSRFDLVYLLLDKVDETRDRRLARHLVSLYMEDTPMASVDCLSIEVFTRYLSYAREHVQPEIDDAAAQLLVESYVELRSLGQHRRITATTRQLESMIRLSEAHARMRMSPLVESSDVHEASRLLRAAMKTSATDPRTGLIDMDLINTVPIQPSDFEQVVYELETEQVLRITGGRGSQRVIRRLVQSAQLEDA
ncbi:MCM2/3/5 family-domain-containing protein [Syncephalis fuscata]|nr:MCM2/3/5 family-domain-containing protein [Syncephalis fuscata]